jgi:hypothetical protein
VGTNIPSTSGGEGSPILPSPGTPAEGTSFLPSPGTPGEGSGVRVLTPKQAAKLRILDPACGSGSFLLGAYRYLLDWHRDWYVNDGLEKNAKVLYQSPGGYRLTTAEKKRILLNNIYGVDIDPQAVEVTKLSLLLKVLEGESHETITSQLRFVHERALPDLSGNIKCRNSLIGPDFYDNQQMQLFDEEERLRINVFDWNEAFPKIMKAGGFDAVIGNPPYIRIQTMKEWAPTEVEYYRHRYVAASKGNYDIYVVFVERGIGVLNSKGRLGFILPHKFFNAQYGEPLRRLLADGKYVDQIVHFGHDQVFEGATTYTCLMILDKGGADTLQFVKVEQLDKWRAIGSAARGLITADQISSSEWNMSVGSNQNIIKKLSMVPKKLGSFGHIFVGTQTSADDVFVLNDCHIEGEFVAGFSPALEAEVSVEVSCTKPFLRGKDIRRYVNPDSTSRLICPYEITNSACRLFSQEEMKTRFPLATAYLENNQSSLASREKGKLKGAGWYAFGYPKSMTLFLKTKIIVPDYNNSASFTYDKEGHFYKTGYGIIVNEGPISPLYLLGILNTSLLYHYLTAIGTSLRGGYVRFWTQYLDQLPIREIDFSDPTDKSRHDRMVSLVEQMLALHKQLATARTPH